MQDNDEEHAKWEKILKHHAKQSLRHSSIIDSTELELFRYYVEDSEEVLQKMFSEEQAYIKEQMSSGNPEINDSGMLAVDYFFKRVRFSHVIYMVSLLETCLQSGCRRLEVLIGEENIPIKLNELKGTQWDTKRRFLEAYGQVKIESSMWNPIKRLIEIRNILVHDNGDAQKLSEQRKNEMLRAPGVSEVSGELIVDANFIRGSFEALKALIGYIEKTIRNTGERDTT